MHFIFYEKKDQTIIIRLQVQFLEKQFWRYFFTCSLFPVWALLFWIGVIVWRGIDEQLLLAMYLPLMCLLTYKGVWMSVRDDRICLEQILKKRNYELLRVKEGCPYIYVNIREPQGTVCVRQFRIRDQIKNIEGLWELDINRMVLQNYVEISKK